MGKLQALRASGKRVGGRLLHLNIFPLRTQLLRLKYYPLRTQKALNIAGFVASFIETALPSLPE